jgi:hypothetical protein
MKLLRHSLFNFAAAVPVLLLLCAILVSIGWVFSYRFPSTIVLTRDSSYGMGHGDGVITVVSVKPRGSPVVAIRYWWIVATLATMALAFEFWRRSRRRHWALELGLCGHCGYDLRATPDRCPECGLVPDLGKRDGVDLQ